MIDIENYICRLIELLKEQFDSRLLYVGLQGSYLRKEATPLSDIDVMIVIDQLKVSDLDCYRSIIQSLEHYDKSCGFICSKSDLFHWNPLEICHLSNTTKDYFGVLKELVPAYTERDVRNFTKLSINNLYHEICHRYIHAEQIRNISDLRLNYKNVFFILQSLYYLKHGKYISTKAELLSSLDGKDHSVFARSVDLSNGILFDFLESFELLFTWCQETLKSI